jgi:hypothetical protein
MEILDENPESEILTQPVKPGAIRIILADSQAIYRVGIRKVFALEDDIAWWRRPIRWKICVRPSNAIPQTSFCWREACWPARPT